MLVPVIDVVPPRPPAAPIAPVPVATPKVEFFLNNALAQFDSTAVNAADVFSPIYQHMNSSACDGQPIDIPSTGSSIVGSCRLHHCP